MDLVDQQLALARIDGMTAARLRRLCAAIDPPPRSLSCLYELSATLRQLVDSTNWRKIGEDRRAIESNGIQLIDLLSAHYPPALAELRDAPVLLYVQGDAACLSAPQLAMVAARQPSPAGEGIARTFARQLGAAGLAITSGLAEGIDAASHEGALSA